MKKSFWYLVGFLSIVLAAVVYYFKPVMVSNTTSQADTQRILIYPGNTLLDVSDSLLKYNLIDDKKDFLASADLLQIGDDDIKPGRFKLSSGWTNFKLLKHITKGQQDPVKLVINPMRKIENVAGLLGRNLLADSLDFQKFFTDSTYLKKEFGLDLPNAITLFIPNTYEVYWTIKPEALLERMKKENDKFWTQNDRDRKLSASGFTKQQVATLASIVDKETTKDVEKPIVAGLYMNRLEQGELLRADPTAVFGYGDFTVKRVTERQTKFDSPYNTYLYSGLPPGPIFMPTITGIDAVLNREKHDYLFMVARPDYSGLHDFSVTYPEHIRKANIYREWLTQQGIGL